MATVENKTPEQIAAAIVEATKDQQVTISGVRYQELVKVVRARHAQDIEVFGPKYAEKNLSFWITEYLNKFIENTFKQQVKVINNKTEKAKLDYFNLLVSKGTDKVEAMKMAGL